MRVPKRKAPLKGKGNKRVAFVFDGGRRASALREAFWAALPDDHKTEELDYARGGNFRATRCVSPEAWALFLDAARTEVARLASTMDILARPPLKH